MSADSSSKGNDHVVATGLLSQCYFTEALAMYEKALIYWCFIVIARDVVMRFLLLFEIHWLLNLKIQKQKKKNRKAVLLQA